MPEAAGEDPLDSGIPSLRVTAVNTVTIAGVLSDQANADPSLAALARDDKLKTERRRKTVCILVKAVR